MEALAQEKTLLASSQANLQSNYDTLTKLLDKEQALNVSLQAQIKQSDEIQQTLHQNVKEKNSEISSLTNQLMLLQAQLEKERNLNKINEEKLLKYDEEMKKLVEINNANELLIKVHENEKEEFKNIIQVITEERDSARIKEEELYEKLQEVTYDLEKLQESYVFIADKCNDAQDEASELKDQLQNLQESYIALQRKSLDSDNFYSSSSTSPVPLTSSISAPAKVPSYSNDDEKDNEEKEAYDEDYEDDYQEDFD